MDINDYIRTKGQLTKQNDGNVYLKLNISNDNDIHPDIVNFIKNNKVTILDMSNCNLTRIPTFVPDIIDVKRLIFRNNRITDIPNSILDFNWKNLITIDLFNNPINIRPAIFRNYKDFIDITYGKENKDYINNSRPNYLRISRTTDDNIKNYTYDIFHKKPIHIFKEHNIVATYNLSKLINIFKNENFENYDNISVNILNKLISSSILNFLFQKDINVADNYVKGLKINEIIDLVYDILKINSDKKILETMRNLVSNIFLSEFIFNDENATRYLGEGSYNVAYELSDKNNLYILKEVKSGASNKYESYKEYIASFLLNHYVGNYVPNFYYPIMIFNVDNKEIKTHKIKKDDIVTNRYLCDYDKKYYLNNSQYIFTAGNDINYNVKTFLNSSDASSSSMRSKNSIYMTKNVEYGVSLYKYMYSLYRNNNKNEITTKMLNIISQMIRGLTVAYSKIGFTHGDCHSQNIMINKLDSPTYINEFYKNPYINYKYHKTDEVVIFIDYGMSSVLIDKLDKSSKSNIVNINSGILDQNVDPILDMHRIYYSMMTDLYKYLFNEELNMHRGRVYVENILHMIKIVYIYLGGFFYEDKRIPMNISENDLYSIINNDKKIGKYFFIKYEDFNYGYLPSMIRGVLKDKICSSLHLYTYFFRKYTENFSQLRMGSTTIEFTDNITKEFIDNNKENNDRIVELIEDIELVSDKNCDSIHRYLQDPELNKNKISSITPNDKYPTFVNSFVNDQKEIIDFLTKTSSSIFDSIKSKSSTMVNEVEKSLLYVNKATSVYLLSYKKMAYYFIFNKLCNNDNLDYSIFDTSKINYILNGLSAELTKMKNKNTNIKEYQNMLSEYILALQISSQNKNKISQPIKIGAPAPVGVAGPSGVAPAPLAGKSGVAAPVAVAAMIAEPAKVPTFAELQKKTVNELKVILQDKIITKQNEFNQYLKNNNLKQYKFKKSDYISAIIYLYSV